MAKRPIFIPGTHRHQLVKTVMIDFTWYPGLSYVQKQRSIMSLHEAAQNQLGIKNILEISSKSQSKIGVQLSAFHLLLQLNKGKWPVEVIFQASKVFEQGGPFEELYQLTPHEARKDPRLKNSGRLQKFTLEDKDWPLEPKTAFYDWLYLNALQQNQIQLGEYEAYTDIEFNPLRSFSCQAYSAALYQSLERQNLLSCLQSPYAFLDLLNETLNLKPIQKISNQQLTINFD